MPITRFGRLDEPNAILICVPTPLSKTRDPDISYVQSATEAVAKNLRRGQLIILESTTYPGTTREILPGLTVHTGGKHTFASQYAAVRTAAGTVVLASDNAYLYENLATRTPIAQTLDSASNRRAQERMLQMAKVGKNDVLFDLGCGDGRIVVTAAQKYGARGVGVDINPERIKDSNENAQKAGVTDRVKFLQQDLFQTDLRDATVITLYLLPAVNMKLRPKLLQLKAGTRSPDDPNWRYSMVSLSIR